MPVMVAHIDLINTEFERRRQKNGRYSLRAFAKTIGISHTILSLILSGKRPLSSKMALLMIDRLALTPEQSKILLDSQKASRRNGERGHDELSIETFDMISDWVHYAILSIFETPDAQFDPAWIARRLNIDESRAEGSLQKLVSLDLLAKVDGQWKQTGRPLKIENPVSTAVTKEFNKKLLGKAIESLENDPMELRNLSSTTFAVDPTQVSYAVRRIREFRRKLTAELEAKGSPREVYSLTVQFFPLTRGV